MKSKMTGSHSKQAKREVLHKEAVPDEDIALALQAGFCAPPSHGRSPWHAVVVKDQAVKDTLPESTIGPK